MYRMSVLLPSAYPEKLQAFLSNLREKSYDFSSLEIIVVLDGYEPDWWDGNIKYVYTPPTNFRSKFFEIAYRHTTADWIWMANDDLEIVTQDWDAKLDFGKDPWKMYYFKDNQYNGEFACHPLTSRKLWELMDSKGLVFPPYVNMGCDTTIWDVLPYQCKVYRPDIELIHNRFLDENKQQEIMEDYANYNQLGPTREAVRLEIVRICGLKDVKVAIAVPTGEYARKPEFYSYLNVMNKPSNSFICTAIGQSPAKGRNMLIDQAIKNKCTHIFFVDDDMIMPSSALTMLLAHDVDVVTGLYLHRNYPHKPLIFDYKDEETGACMHHFLSDKEAGMVEIVNAGLGCCLINLKIFEGLERPYIRLGEIDKDEWNDDVGFFNRVTKAGYKIYCDLDVMCGHIFSGILWPYRDTEGIWQTRYDTKGTGMISTPQIKGKALEERLKLMELANASV